MKSTRMASTTAALAVLFCGSASAGNVITVDDSGPADFALIQPAVDAAIDGDTILVKPGNYSGFTVDGKALTIIGDVGALPVVAGQIRVKNTANGSTVVIARLKATGTPTPSTPDIAMVIDHSPGAVRIVGCDLAGGHGYSGTSGTAAKGRRAIDVVAADDVAFAACAAIGGNGYYDVRCDFDESENGGAGIHSSLSTIALYDCDVRGGRGGTGYTFNGPVQGPRAMGGHAFDSVNADFSFASNCHVQGGDGATTPCMLGEAGGDGGTGMYVGWDHPTHLLDNDIVGSAGSPGFPSGDPGTPVVGIQPFWYVVPSFQLAMPAIAREGEFITLTFRGTPGDQVFLNDGLTTTFALVPSYRGVVLAPFPQSSTGPVREIKWGVIPASGVLTRTYGVPQLPAGEQARTRFLQAYRVRASGITLGSFATLTVLDASL